MVFLQYACECGESKMGKKRGEQLLNGEGGDGM